MPSCGYGDEFDWRRFQRLRERIRRDMIAANFQIGGKFDTVLRNRAIKAYNRGEQR